MVPALEHMGAVLMDDDMSPFKSVSFFPKSQCRDRLMAPFDRLKQIVQSACKIVVIAQTYFLKVPFQSKLFCQVM